MTRAEDLIDCTGLRIGLFAGLAGQHIQSASAGICEGADRDGPAEDGSSREAEPASGDTH